MFECHLDEQFTQKKSSKNHHFFFETFNWVEKKQFLLNHLCRYFF